MKKHSDALWEAWVRLIPWIPVVLSLCWQRGGKNMDGGQITIIAAIIAMATSFGVESLKAFRNGKTIAAIRDVTSEKIKPQVDYIAKESAYQTEKLNSLVSDLEHRKRMEAQHPAAMEGQSMMLAGTNLILTEYHEMQQRYNDLKTQYGDLRVKYHELSGSYSVIVAEKTRLQEELSKAKADLDRLKGQAPQPNSPVPLKDDWEYEP